MNDAGEIGWVAPRSARVEGGVGPSSPVRSSKQFEPRDGRAPKARASRGEG